MDGRSDEGAFAARKKLISVAVKREEEMVSSLVTGIERMGG